MCCFAACLAGLYGASGVADYLVARERSSARRARYVRHAHAAIANSSVRRIHLNIVIEYPGQEYLHASMRTRRAVLVHELGVWTTI